jgi:hypothetical protein
MAWQEDMTTLLRYVVNDYTTPYENTDGNLQRLLVTAAQLTKKDVDFDVDYAITIAATGISPDPFSINDNGFINLVVLKAACLLARGEQKKKGQNALAIKDGPSNVDGRGPADAMKNWANTVCAEYAQAELEYRLGNNNAGQAIVGPYHFDNATQFGSPNPNRTYYRGGDSADGSYFS